MKNVLVEGMYLYCIKHKLTPHIVCSNCPPYLNYLSDNGNITLNLSDHAVGYVNFNDGLVKIGVSFNRKHYDLEFDINKDVLAIYDKDNPDIGLHFKPNDLPIEPQKTKKRPHLRIVK